MPGAPREERGRRIDPGAGRPEAEERRPPRSADLPPGGAARADAPRDLVAALDALDVGVVLVHRDLTVAFANDAVARLAGRATADLVGLHLGDLLPGAHAPLDGPPCRQTLADGAVRAWRVGHGPTDTGGALDVRASRTSQGMLVLQVTTSGAGATLEAAQATLLEHARLAGEARSNFLATLSHELRTPLSALAGYSELLADEILGPLSAEQQEMMQRLCAVVGQLGGMIDEMLTFSSLEGGRELVRATEVGSADLLHATLAVVEPAARQKALSVHLELPAEPPRLVTDPEKVRQILVSLGSNAVKFTDAGAITLAVRQEDGHVRFAVRDTGVGIPAHAHALVFEPFTQLDAGLTRRHGGVGLGLHIASRLAGLLRGRLELCSAPGEGSTFELVLPAA